jgi:hypothetical protein
MTEETKANAPQDSAEGQARIRNWKDFKQLVLEKKPGSIVYILEQNGFSADKEVTILRVIMLHDRRYFIFIDAPKGEALRETAIPIRKDKNGVRFLEDDDVRSFLKGQFEGAGLEIYSFWTT